MLVSLTGVVALATASHSIYHRRYDRVSSNADLFWAISLVTAVVAGVVLGFVRAWWFALLGAVLPAAILVVIAQFVTNDTLPGTEDMSWRIVLVVIAVEVAVLFFGSFGHRGGATRAWSTSAVAGSLGSLPSTADPPRLDGADPPAQASTGAAAAAAPSVSSTSRMSPERQVKMGVSRSV